MSANETARREGTMILAQSGMMSIRRAVSASPDMSGALGAGFGGLVHASAKRRHSQIIVCTTRSNIVSQTDYPRTRVNGRWPMLSPEA
eukprot:4805355-Prymnesium_polylepis.2